MTTKARELLERALQLSPRERRRLAQDLLESIDDSEEETSVELDPVFVKELERRLVDEPPKGERWPTVHEVIDRLRRDLELGPVRARKRARGS